MLTNDELDAIEKAIRTDGEIMTKLGKRTDLLPDRGVRPAELAVLFAMARGMLKTNEIHAEQRERVATEIASVKAAMVPASEKGRVRDLEKTLARERSMRLEFAALLDTERKKVVDLEAERAAMQESSKPGPDEVPG